MNPPPLSRALEQRLKPLMEAERLLWRRKIQVMVFFVAALLLPAVTWILLKNGYALQPLSLVSMGIAALILMVASFGANHHRIEMRQLARRVEGEHPELQATLLTALDQASENKPLSYLQECVMHKALAHSMKHDWFGVVTRRRITLWSLAAFAMMLFFAVSFFATQKKLHQYAVESPASNQKNKTTPGVISVIVKPGDAEVERGGRLIVEARFTGGTPAEMAVVISDTADIATERSRESMKPTVETGHYGGLIRNIDRDGFYRVLFDGHSSPTYRITTYVHPELVRADVIITPPAYTHQPVKEIKNTQNVSVLEGSSVKFQLKINKPIAVAELYGQDKTIVPLSPDKSNPLLLVGNLIPEKTQKYQLHLVDARERSSKQPAWFSVQVIKDQPPRIEVVFPKRDLAVSPIQEMPLEARVWDDQGVQRSGAVFTLAGKTHEIMLNDAPLKGGQNHVLKTLLDLEKLKAEPKQLVSYFVWAEDVSPEGKVRRSQSDLFFAEVRQFEDIFREGESPPGEAGEEGNQMQKLVELQKQVVNANWHVWRDSNGGRAFDQLAPDVKIVSESEGIALAQTEAVLKKVKDAEIKVALFDATKGMKSAVEVLDMGLEKKQPVALEQALTPEREALEALYRAQSREHLVMRSKSSKSSSSSKKAADQQLMELELKQKEQRYEEEKAATEEKTAEQQENLQVLNRLKELARRQEALAEKIKEVESQMQKAGTDEQKRELEQQLKTLQEEQQQLLRDLDELKSRMEKPENQSQMAQEKEKLEQAREQARQAAEQLAQQQTSSAANSATRAQKSLEEVRDEFRERTAKQFASEMKKLKQDAATLTENEEKLAQAMNQNVATNEIGKSGSDLEKSLETAKQERAIQSQRENLEKLLEQMRQLSEQSEASEPLLSTALHDAVRNAHSDGVDKALAETQENARFGSSKDAQTAERKAAEGIDKLQKGVEKAAEGVLGSETESLRMARAELDRLLKDAGSDKPADEKSSGDHAAKSGQIVQPKKDVEMTDASAGKSDASSPKGKSPADQAKVGEQGAAPTPQGKSEQANATDGKGKSDMPKGQQPGEAGKEGGEPGRGSSPGTPSSQGKGMVTQGGNSSASGGADNNHGGLGDNKGLFFEQVTEVANDNPVTGENYGDWTDRLRKVEEALNAPELRNQASRVLDNAREMRADYHRNNQPPQSAQLQTRITEPLAELRNRVAEELAKREAINPLAPLDRDPVPQRYREMVRRYYQELGAGN